MNTQQSYRINWASLVPTTRLGWIALALGVVLSLSTVSYAMSPLLRQLFLYGDDGLLYIEQANLGQELNLIQTTNGFTINVNWVYADANRIVIGYTVSSPSLTNEFAMSMTLADKAGSDVPLFDVRSTSVQNGMRAFVASFDASTLQEQPATLQLTMEPGQIKQASNPHDGSTWHSLAAPVRFDLRMSPSADRRIIDLRQKAHSSGVSLILGRICKPWRVPCSIAPYVSRRFNERTMGAA
jgi:hypothetical protein